MKKILMLGALTLLAGCTAGLKDSFDCNATAQDSCMTMEAANKMAAQKTGGISTKGGTPQKRVELPRLAPLATPTRPVMTTALPAAPRGSLTSNAVLSSAPEKEKGRTSAPLTALAENPAPRDVTDISSTTWAAWSDIGMAPPQRLPATTARLWIAAWIDEDENFYQPAVVSFVAKEGEWRAQLP